MRSLKYISLLTFFLGVNIAFAATTIGTSIETGGNLLVTGSTTLQDFTANNATTTSATTTNFTVTNRIQFYGAAGAAGAVRLNPDLIPDGAGATFEASARRLLMYGSGTGADATSIRQVGIGQALSFIGYRGEGTTASPTALSSGSAMANFGAGGYSTAWAVVTKANMQMLATETWGASANGTRIDFRTTPNQSTTESARMTINENGSIGIGTTTPISSLVVMASSSSATTTTDFGDIYSTNSRACFNVKNVAGSNISFYFVGTSMVVENNKCK